MFINYHVAVIRIFGYIYRIKIIKESFNPLEEMFHAKQCFDRKEAQLMPIIFY